MITDTFYFDSLSYCDDVEVRDGKCLYETSGTKLASRNGFKSGHFWVYRFLIDPKKKSHWDMSIIYIYNSITEEIKYDPLGYITNTIYRLEREMLYHNYYHIVNMKQFDIYSRDYSINLILIIKLKYLKE